MSTRSGSREGEIVELSQITITVGDISQVDETADIIKVLLEKYHQDVRTIRSSCPRSCCGRPKSCK